MPRTRCRKLNPGVRLALSLSIGLLRRMLGKTQIVRHGRWECWEWTGYCDENGYGQIKVDGRARWIHRVSYAAFKRPLPAGEQVDHKCRNPACWRPHHLRKKCPIRHAAESGARSHDDDIPF